MIHKTWGSQIMADYFAAKRDKLLINPVRMNLQMMLSKRSQILKNTVWMVPFMSSVTYCMVTMHAITTTM